MSLPVGKHVEASLLPRALHPAIRTEKRLDVLFPVCCGLDVPKKPVVAGRRTAGPAGRVHRETRTFATTTAALRTLVDWRSAAGCTHLAMESTGVHWKPVSNRCEPLFTVWVVNAQHVTALAGRKPDVKDAEWIADLLQHGRLEPSFIPSRLQRERRERVRYRTAIIREPAAEVNRIQKVLEGANRKLASVARDVLGVAGRAILQALAAGVTDAATLADLARGKLRQQRAALVAALTGVVQPHQRFLLAEQLTRIDSLEESIARLNREIASRLAGTATERARLVPIPGVGDRVADVVLAEVGSHLDRFPDARHFASWIGLCPGNEQSAGKRLNGKTRKGNPALRSALVEAAWGASHTKGTYLAAQYRRLVARRGKKRALVAVAHSIAGSIYHLLTPAAGYPDLGANFFDEQDRTRVERRLVARLERLGSTVTVTPAVPQPEPGAA
jgi:transposase